MSSTKKTTAKPTATKLAVGELWEFKAKGDRVDITRPDGSVTTVAARRGKARLRLTQEGSYTAGDQTVTVTPGRAAAAPVAPSERAPARAPAKGEPDADTAATG